MTPTLYFGGIFKTTWMLMPAPSGVKTLRMLGA